MSDELVERLAKALFPEAWSEATTRIVPGSAAAIMNGKIRERAFSQARACLSEIEAAGYTQVPPMKVKGTTFVCELPSALGEITGMRVENGRLICDTVSGVPFVVNADPEVVNRKV